MKLNNGLAEIDDTTGEYSPTISSDDTLTGDGTASNPLSVVGSAQDPIISFLDFTTSEPASPITGDRYINTVTGTSSQTAQSVTIDYIYEWDGSAPWIETVPTEGFKVYDISTNKFYIYTGTGWIIDTDSLVNTNVIYYAKQGSSANSGKNINDPVDNVDTALSKVSSPSSTNQYRVVGLDGASSSGTVSIPQYTSVICEGGTHSGRFSFNGNYSKLKMGKVISPISTDCLYSNGPYLGFADVDILECSVNAQAIDLNLGAVLRVNIKYIDATATSAKAYDLSSSTLLGTIITLRSNVAPTKDGASALGAYIHDNGGLAGTESLIYNDFSDIEIHADGNDATLKSTGGTAYVAGATADINGATVSSTGFLDLDNFDFKIKRITGTTGGLGVSATFSTGLAKSKIVGVLTSIDSLNGSLIQHSNGAVALNSFNEYCNSSGSLVLRVSSGQTDLPGRPFRTYIIYIP